MVFVEEKLQKTQQLTTMVALPLISPQVGTSNGPNFGAGTSRAPKFGVPLLPNVAEA